TQNGGLAVAALDFPEPPEQRPVAVRIWYDPTPIPAELRDIPLTRYGYATSPAAPGTPIPGLRSRTESLRLKDRALHLETGDELQWSTDHGWTPGERIEVFRLPGPPAAAIGLDQYIPGRGWVHCPAEAAYLPDSDAFRRADPTASIAGEALFRLTAVGPVEMAGVKVTPAP
ncbi:MAG TPA: hypothetical protein VEI97_03310, partial [bacterium]|nr:hypothetical protein [bacterium]